MVITQEMVLDVFSRINDWSGLPIKETIVQFNIVNDEQSDFDAFSEMITSIVYAHADAVILGMPLTDPFAAATKGFIVGMLMGRLEMANLEREGDE